jgi:hypothetical protein
MTKHYNCYVSFVENQQVLDKLGKEHMEGAMQDITEAAPVNAADMRGMASLIKQGHYGAWVSQEWTVTHTH